MSSKLTPEQESRIKNLSESISEEKLTVGFSIENRDTRGSKKWCMVSRTISLRDKGYTFGDSRILSCLLGKRVTAEVLRDAVVRGLLSGGEAKAELESAFLKYDTDIARFMGEEHGSK